MTLKTHGARTNIIIDVEWVQEEELPLPERQRIQSHTRLLHRQLGHILHQIGGENRTSKTQSTDRTAKCKN